MDHLDWHMARAALQWQAELGVRDAVGDVPIDRYDAPAQSPKPATAAATQAGATRDADLPAAAMAVAPAADPVAVAEAAAAAAEDLPALKRALQNFSHCDLRRGARNLVFGRGTAGVRVMILEDAPGRAEDMEGLPFAGPAGQLLDKMCAAIGLHWARGGLHSLGDSLASAARPRGQRGGTRNDAAILASSYHLSRARGCHLHGQYKLSGDFRQRRPEQAARRVARRDSRCRYCRWCIRRACCASLRGRNRHGKIC